MPSKALCALSLRLGSAEMAKILRADYDNWGPVIRASGFKAD